MSTNYENLEDTLCNLVIEQQVKTARKSSKIKEWLGREISQSGVIKLGNILENLFNSYLIHNKKSMLHTLQKCASGHCITDKEGNTHQVDIYALLDDGTYVTLEMKCNLDLDRGKKRDVMNRERAIFNTLSDALGDVDIISGIFNPFFYEEQPKRLNWEGENVYLYGLPWLIENLELPFSVEDFQELGKSTNLKECLDLIT